MNKDILRKIRSVKLCLMASPYNTKDSEFADRISDMEELEKIFSAAPVPDKVEAKEIPWDYFVDKSKEILIELRMLNKIRDWLIEKSKDKPVGERYSYDEVAVLISNWQSTQSDAVEFAEWTDDNGWWREVYNFDGDSEKLWSKTSSCWENITTEQLYQLFKQNK